MTDREKVIKGLYEAVVAINDHVPVEYVGYAEAACLDAITLLREQTQVVRCTGCKYWYRDSGLTARRCEKHGIITKQFDFCSYGEKVQNA